MKLTTKLAALLTATLLASPALAQDADFYKGKSVDLYIGYAPGGGYDTYARLVARHMGDFLPGKPNFVPKNMAGGGGRVVAGYIFKIAPKDGTAIATADQSLVLQQAIGDTTIQFDMNKFVWIGNPSADNNTAVTWHTTGVKTIDEAKQKEVIVGATGPNTSAQLPQVMNAILGTKFKIVHGYVNQPPIFLAMERGELQGAGGPFYSSLRTTHPEYLRDNKVTIIVQIALEKHPDLPNVPLLLDFAKTQEDRQEIELAVASLLMGRPYVLPEGVPADRVKILQDSFMETMKDPALLQEAQKLKLEINAIDGSAVHALLAKMYSTPQPIIDKVTAIFVPKDK